MALSGHSCLTNAVFATIKGKNKPYGRKTAMELSAVLTPTPEGGYVAYNPETGTTTQGETLEEAIKNLQEATELYLEEFPLSSYIRPLLTSFHVPDRA
jgi:predicted RNase H-like HicB family nuclease